MNERLLKLAERIRTEMAELDRVLERSKTGLQRARQSNDDYYLDGVALNLHGFYSGLERIFEQIAETLDSDMPSGENWHMLLLQQMTQEKAGIRPAVISGQTSHKLNEYRGFRHVVRNVYTYRFDPVKLEKLVGNAPIIFELVKAELLAFASFLEKQT